MQHVLKGLSADHSIGQKMCNIRTQWNISWWRRWLFITLNATQQTHTHTHTHTHTRRNTVLAGGIYKLYSANKPPHGLIEFLRHRSIYTRWCGCCCCFGVWKRFSIISRTSCVTRLLPSCRTRHCILQPGKEVLHFK